MSTERGVVPTEEKVLTAKVLIVGIVLSVLLSLVSLTFPMFLIPGNMLKLGDLVGSVNAPFPSLILSFGLVSLVGAILTKMKLDPRKYAIIYSMILVSTIYAGGYGYPMHMLGVIGQWRVNTAYLQNYGPYLLSWIPSRDVLLGMTTGGQAVPWAAWTIPLLITWTGALIYLFLWSALSNIFRRQWIDIERMDFVFGTVHTSTILNIAPTEKERSSIRYFVTRRKFVIGAVLGAAFELQMALNIMYPWFPSVTAAWLKWPWVSWHPGTLDFGVAVGPAFFDSLPGWTGLLFGHPAGFALAFLVPVEILLTSGIFMWVQSSLIPMIMSIMGMVPKPAFPGGGSRYGYNAWYYGSSLGQGNPYLGSMVSNWGFWLGLGLFPLLVGGNWRYVRDTFRAITKGPSKEEKENEAMPYRWAWIILAICVVAFLAWSYGFWGLGLGAGILWVGYWAISQLAWIRMKAAGHITRDLGDDWQGPPYYFHNMYPPMMGLPMTYAELQAVYPNSEAVSWYGVKFLMGYKGFSSVNTEMWAGQTLTETYKVGSNLGVKPRAIFNSVMIATLIVMSISLPLGLSFWYTYGIKPEGLAYIWSGSNSLAGAFDIPSFAWVGTPDKISWKLWATGLISFLGMGAMVWLRAHFVWFPLSPVGAAIGVGHGNVFTGWGYTYFITYFLKRLALRVGGIRFYEDWIVPVAIGFIAGYGIGVLLWGASSMIVFLYR